LFSIVESSHKSQYSEKEHVSTPTDSTTGMLTVKKRRRALGYSFDVTSLSFSDENFAHDSDEANNMHRQAVHDEVLCRIHEELPAS
jgi:hypothetical protein